MKQNTKTTKSRTRSIFGALPAMLVLVLCLCLMAGCENKEPDSKSGAGTLKSFSLTAVHRDGSSKVFNIESEQENLGAALVDQGLIEGEEGQYGLFITTVDGETADSSKQEWWCLTAGGEQVMTGVDSTPIEDGGAYELTLTTGY